MSGKVVQGLTLSQAADLAGLTVQGLQATAKSADPAPKGANGFPAREFGQWLKRRHLRGVGVDTEGVRYDYDAERARLTKSQADKAELEAMELRGEMVRAEEVIETWARMLTAMRARLLGLPTKAAPVARSAEGDEEAARVIETEILEALAELSENGLPERTRARRARRLEHSEATAAPDGEPVGRRTSAPEPRKRSRTGAVAD